MTATGAPLLMLEPLRRRPSFASLLTPEQAAQALGVSVRELDGMRVAGNGPTAFAVSPRIVRYVPDAIAAWKTNRGA